VRSSSTRPSRRVPGGAPPAPGSRRRAACRPSTSAAWRPARSGQPGTRPSGPVAAAVPGR